MKGKTHLLIGGSICTQAAVLIEPRVGIFSIPAAVLFALIPDIDEPGSTINGILLNKRLTKGLFKFAVYGLNILIMYLSLRLSRSFLISAAATFVTVIVLERILNEKRLRRHLLSFEILLVGLLLWYIGTDMTLAVCVILASLIPYCSHRGLTHSLIFSVIIFFVLRRVENLLLIRGIGQFTGISFLATLAYLSHIAADSLTAMGVPLFYPLSKKCFFLPGLRVGGRISNSVEVIICILMVLLIITGIIRLFNISVFEIINKLI